MYLELDNIPTATHLWFGTPDTDEETLFTHKDLFAAMKVCNLALHQWIITTKPEIFHNYIKFVTKNHLVQPSWTVH